MIGQKLGIATLWGQAFLGQRVIIAGIDAIDGIQCIDSVADRLAKGSDRILVLGLGDNAGTGGQADSRLEANDSVPLRRIDD